VQSPVLYWDQSTGQWVRAPSVASGLLLFHSTPEIRLEGFIAEVRGTRQPTKGVDVSQCVSGASGLPLAQPNQVTTASVGAKSKHPLLKLQCYDGSESLDTFLLKFRHMAVYLQWNEEHKFNHLCASLDGPAGQVLWKLPPHALTADLERLLLQAERFESELCIRRRAKGESLQDLHRDITCHIRLAYPGADNVLVIHIGIEAFIVLRLLPNQVTPQWRSVLGYAMRVPPRASVRSKRVVYKERSGARQLYT